MSMAAVSDTPAGMVVPIDVAAFCVGAADPQFTGKFAGASVDYTALTTKNPQAFLGGNATRGLAQDALNPLEQGIHLHWALPDALTRATSTGGGLDFPAVPDRWLVTRLVAASDGTLKATSFVIESDRLNADAPTTASLPIPVQPAGTAAASDPVPAFEYLGQSWPLDSYPAAAPGRSLKAGTGTHLTAVANGLPSFAAYYPESRNSFGFLDTVAGVPAGSQVTYVVTGWHDESANDPVQLAGSRLDSNGDPVPLSQSHLWAGAEGAGYSLYSGMIEHVAWDPNRPYVPNPPPPIAADLALANTPSEALAAYYANLLCPKVPLVEQLLTALQQGLWDRLTQPTTDRLPAIAEAIHDSQFRKIESGTIYTIHQQIDGQDSEAIDLPKGIADALNTLNDAAAALLEASNAVDSFRWQVFADWYRYFLSPNATDAQVVWNHFRVTLDPAWAGLSQSVTQASSARDAALAALRTLLLLRPDLALREEPGPRYFQPNDPAMLLLGADLAMPARYGGDGDHQEDGTLVCRPTNALVTSVTVANITKTAADYAAVAALPGPALPYGADCSALIAEACLLNTATAAIWSGVAQATLDTGLDDLLQGKAGTPWKINAGAAPSPVEIGLWSQNPWLPVFLTWEAGYAAVHPTLADQQNYPADFFTANYTISADEGSFIAYTPSGAGIDPAGLDYSNGYDGYTILSRKAAENFEALLEAFPSLDGDPLLKAILASLQDNVVMVQPLAGFTQALVNRHMLMQVAVVSPPAGHGSDPIAPIFTRSVTPILKTDDGPATYHVTPEFNSPFNPIRAGYLSLEDIQLFAVDAFGQKRPVQLNAGRLFAAASMAAGPAGGAIEPDFAFAAPRIAQPSRLLFQWLSAADGTTAEYNGHPAESPICGWLLPNHLTGGFFLYDADGGPIGSLFVAGDDSQAGSRIIWQGAPGNDRDIDQNIEQDAVLAAAHPELRKLALQLGNTGSVDNFKAFYSAVDGAHGSISPANAATDAGLAVLVGRPVALVQAALRLDLRGTPWLSQNQACLQNDNEWVDTDAGLTGVEFPVVLGDLDRLDDGLIGYFRGKAGGGFDLGTFFSEAAAQGATGAVVQPTQSTLLVAPGPQLPPPPPAPAPPPPEALRVMMLVDPRAPVHAISGILPTQSLLVPPDLASSAMSSLEFSIQAAPVLRTSGGLALPTPSENGFQIAFLEQIKVGADPLWFAQPEIAPSVAGAMWSYTPQTLTEGWLRFNPSVLTAALVNGDGQPIANGGASQAMTLNLVNRKPAAITFTPGIAASEGSPPRGSIFYVHFGNLVAEADVSAISLSALGWTFTPFSDSVYGTYFGATATAAVTLAPAPGVGASAAAVAASTIEIAVTGLKAATGIAQAHLFVDYYAVTGIADGVAEATVTVIQPPPPPPPPAATAQ
jgi:hypothetical protein